MDSTKTREVKEILLKIIDEEKDSLRFYYLGDKYKNKVEHYGVKESYDMDATLLI